MRERTMTAAENGSKDSARLAASGVLAAALGCACAAPQPQEWSDMFPEHSHFTRMDNNADGYLSLDEIDPQLRLFREFGSWDSNGDERVDYPEFNASMVEVMS